MPKKAVTRLRKSCGQLAGHSRQQAARIAQAATDKVRLLLPEGHEVVNLEQYQQCLGQQLEAIRARLTARDNLHVHELQVDRNLRSLRDDAAKELRERLIQLRITLDGIFGPGGSNRIFEDAPGIPEDPDALLQLTGHVHSNLINPEFALPQLQQAGVIFDREAAASGLEGPYLRLEDALHGLEGTESDSKYSQSEKDLEVAEASRFVGKVARFYEALYALVGHDGLASRVRRSSHRRRSANEEPETEVPDEPTDPPTDPPTDSDQNNLPLAA